MKLLRVHVAMAYVKTKETNMKDVTKMSVVAMFGLFAIAMLLLSIDAWADSWSTPNQGGGKIVVTDRRCPDKSYLSYAYAYNADGTTFKGCWALLDGKIHVVFKGQPERVYEINGFTQDTNI